MVWLSEQITRRLVAACSRRDPNPLLPTARTGLRRRTALPPRDGVLRAVIPLGRQGLRSARRYLTIERKLTAGCENADELTRTSLRRATGDALKVAQVAADECRSMFQHDGTDSQVHLTQVRMEGS